MGPIVQPCKRVVTYDSAGSENGWLLEIASEHDGFTENVRGQVYLTVARPGAVKGYHVHRRRIEHFTCIRGRVTLVLWRDRVRHEFEMGEGRFLTVQTHPGEPHAIVNRGVEDAYVLDVCHPAWRADDPDQITLTEAELANDEGWARIARFLATGAT